MSEIQAMGRHHQLEGAHPTGCLKDWALIVNEPSLKIWRRPLPNSHLYEYKGNEKYLFFYAKFSRNIYIVSWATHTFNVTKVKFLDLTSNYSILIFYRFMYSFRKTERIKKKY